jgi:N-acetylglucosaminyldiphosphoundecaprenol N-acetyl-beta-D-mannosaminyltransferase
MGVVLAALLLNLRRIKKVTANDFFVKICQELSRRNLSIALIGGTPLASECLCRQLASLVSELQVVRFSSGYLSEAQQDSLIAAISNAKPHLVVLAMGQPLQETFALRIRRSFPHAAFLCVGGLFDCIAGINPTPPQLIRRCGLEWLWRLAHSPRRLWKRYVLGIPLLGAYILREYTYRVVTFPAFRKRNKERGNESIQATK